MAKPHQGQFKPRNPKKYKGRADLIFYRSNLELQVMLRFDLDEQIIEWSSEEISIPYLDKTTNRTRRYFPDFLAKMKLKDGGIKIFMIEVKPLSQTKPPSATKRKRKKTILTETLAYVKNVCKWEFARKYCEKKGWEFKILTEHDINSF